ncbi:hypothetical protein PMNALOAF_0774 [Methylobacterium adhaesivum]|uniref:Uncharacterized protein n=1 Tax=Methylobacterium adhaesivum TaxID=333297 RepID=A0ABT8BIR0_9HYPH|nr:hypothetical protein [Methylobacterium adhaesivum]MDN3591069.1 hypothetical protein [Methylobacterium adhaesivum]GJD29541.1 hypothetical protein PMNALOAF_0774 [Methylobacterium adhaesivum]
MSPIRKLDQILMEETPSGCLLTIEDETGDAYQIIATEKQIKVILEDLADYIRDSAAEDALVEHEEMGDE